MFTVFRFVLNENVSVGRLDAHTHSYPLSPVRRDELTPNLFSRSSKTCTNSTRALLVTSDESTGTHEMDACIMDGTTGSTGAVALVSNTRNPIKLANAVATGTQHVLMVGSGAESLAAAHGVAREDTHYFFTQER